MPEQAQVARGCGSLVPEPGSHVGNGWGAQEGTRSGLDLKPTKESAGQRINQTILGPWRRQRYPSHDKSGARGGAASIWPGSGARWGMMVLSISLPPTPSLCLNTLLFFIFLASFMWHFTKEQVFFLYSPQQFFHSYQIKLVTIIANIC